MTINHYTGVLHDLISYNIFFFNRENSRIRAKVYAERDDDIFVYFDEMRKSKHFLDPPESLYPFFFFDMRTPCVTKEYFHKNFDFFTGTDVTFFNLFKDVNAWKRYVFYFYLEGHKDINVEAVIAGDAVEISNAILAMRHHGDRAKTFVNLFHNFEQLTEELVKYLKQMHHKINLFHVKRKGLYEEVIERFCSNENIKILKKSYNIKSEVKLPKQTFSVCFINQYTFLYKHKNNASDYSFILGYNSHLVPPRSVNYKFLIPETASLIYTNPLVKDIMMALKKEELTITKLSMKLPISRPTVDRLIGVLYDDFAVHISRTNGNEKYYKLNPEYLLAIKSVIVEDIDDMLNGLI